MFAPFACLKQLFFYATIPSSQRDVFICQPLFPLCMSSFQYMERCRFFTRFMITAVLQSYIFERDICHLFLWADFFFVFEFDFLLPLFLFDVNHHCYPLIGAVGEDIEGDILFFICLLMYVFPVCTPKEMQLVNMVCLLLHSI